MTSFVMHFLTLLLSVTAVVRAKPISTPGNLPARAAPQENRNVWQHTVDNVKTGVEYYMGHPTEAATTAFQVGSGAFTLFKIGQYLLDYSPWAPIPDARDLFSLQDEAFDGAPGILKSLLSKDQATHDGRPFWRRHYVDCYGRMRVRYLSIVCVVLPRLS